jgi:DNA-binding MarR family transcriptional regulator
VYPEAVDNADPPYSLDAQIGFVLRRATQRHLAIFAEAIPGLTTTQFAVLAKLSELGAMSQNQLGRTTAMDAATIKGVVDRLRRQGLVRTRPDPGDRRRLTIDLSPDGARLFNATRQRALEVSARTLAPLTAAERDRLLALLVKLA